MAKLCIPKEISENLLSAVKAGKINIAKLQKLDSAQRRVLLNKFIGETDAKTVNALFEKAMASTQKNAMKQWVWKNFYGGKPLYTELTIAQSKAMRDAGLKVKDLRNLTDAQRIKELSKYVSEKTAERLNARFVKLQKSGNLANWEEKVIGTTKLFEDKKLKGAFSRLETMNDLGYLNPKQASEFMEDLVSMKMGIDITLDQSTKISKLTTKVSKAFDEVGDDWSFFNEKKIDEYFASRKALENFVEKIDPAPTATVFTDVSARGALLFSMRSLFNSFVFQFVPGITRAVVKRLGTAAMLPGDMSKLQRAQNILSAFHLSKVERQFSRKQAMMGIKFYKKYSYDISRMQNLDDGFHYFGEKFTHVNGPSFKEAETLKEYFQAGVRGHARIMQGALKYAAGGTDAVFANMHRADTTALLAKIVAKNEMKAGKLPKGMSYEQRFNQLAQEASSFNPKSEVGKYIREMGIMDAHYANGTQNEVYGKIAMRFRDTLRFKDYNVGAAIIPFLKIPANMLGTGLEATGPGLIIGAKQMMKGLKMTEKGAGRSTEVAKGLSKMIASGGLLGSAVFLTSLLSSEDFIGAYDWQKRSENNLTRTKNAGSNYFRLGGKWYSTRWLGPMSIPFNALMYSKQSKARGRSAGIGYLQGILSGLKDFPGLKEMAELKDRVERTSKTAPDSLTQVAESMNMDYKSVSSWLSARVLPSFVTYDVMGIFNETKYDALGRPIPKRGDSVGNTVMMFFVGSNLKEDRSNRITREFDRLLNTGNLPVLTEPSKPKQEELIAKYGEAGYLRMLNELKRNYADKVSDLIDSRSYDNLKPEEKKKRIDRIREQEITSKLK